MISPIKILIVDDEPRIVEMLKIMLKLYGYAVTGADSGYKALNAVSSEHYHIALVDIVMPEMSGIEIMAEIKRLSADTRIILMTAYDRNHPQVKQALAANPDKLLYKPLDTAKLLETIGYYGRIIECTDTPHIE